MTVTNDHITRSDQASASKPRVDLVHNQLDGVAVSVVIPVKNQQRMLHRTLTKLGLADHHDVELIVVDNGSTDETADVAAGFGAQIIDAPDANVSQLRNLGARRARGSTVAFLDSDCVPRRGWLDACKSGLAGGASAVGHPYDLSRRASSFERDWCSLSADAADNTWLPAGNLVIDRTAFWAVGGFDESLRSGEDQDLCRRLRENGGTVAVDASFRVRHEGNPQNLRQMFRSEVWHTSSLVAESRRSGPSKLFIASAVSGLGHLLAGIGTFRRSPRLIGSGALMAGGVIGFTMLRRRHNIRDVPHAVRGSAYFEVYYLAKLAGLAREVTNRATYYNPVMTPGHDKGEGPPQD